MGKSLITGITGFVGSHLAEHLLKKGEEVYGTCRWRSPKDNLRGFENKLSFVEMELSDAHSVQESIEKVKPDTIYHLAAQSYVPTSFISPNATITTNIIGTINLLEAVKNTQIDPIIHICSSSEVYGQVQPNEIPIKETNQFRPASPYAVSKVGEDMVALQYFLSYGLKTIRTRMFTHTGPRRGDVFVVSAFAKQIAKIEKKIQEPVLKVGNLDSIRTFADVRDAVRAYDLLTKYCEPGEVYNIGGNTTMKIGQMLEKLLDFSSMKKEIEIKVDSNLLRPSDVTLQIPCIDKFVKATGWKPEINFEKTLKDTLDYWREEIKKETYHLIKKD